MYNLQYKYKIISMLHDETVGSNDFSIDPRQIVTFLIRIVHDDS